MPMLHHLIELRKRIIYILIIFLLFFLIFYHYSDDLLAKILLPLVRELPRMDNIVVTNVTSPLLTPLKLALDFAMLFTTPVFFYQIWAFAAPGLYKNERKLFVIVCVMSVVLFLLGILFCFYGFLPWMFKLVYYSLPEGVHFFPDLESSYNFITRMMLVFGVCFQTPVICVVLSYFKIVSIDNLILFRPYIIILAFIVGMLLTPPDVISQIILAITLWFLFELGILISKMLTMSKQGI